MRLVTTDEMKTWERYWSEQGVSMASLMEIAGRAIYQCVMSLLEERKNGRIAVVAGCGNNGGDALVVARLAALAGVDTRVVLVGNSSQGSELNLQQQKLLVLHGVTIELGAEIKNPEQWLHDVDIVVDGLLGTGYKGSVRDGIRKWIETINERRIKYGTEVVSIDIPTGIDADTGEVNDIAIQASITVTLGAMKRGLCFYPGRKMAGELVFSDLGLGMGALIDQSLPEMVTKLSDYVWSRNPIAHKGTQGHVGMVGASESMEGAILIAASAALATGAGKVTVYVPGGIRRNMVGIHPEVMVRGCGTGSVWRENAFEEDVLNAADALVVGCCMGRNDDITESVLSWIQKISCPYVLDADGLFALAKSRKRILLHGNVITPHLGEAAKLLHVEPVEIERKRIFYAAELSKKYHCVTVLKGAPTIVADANENVYVNMHGNPGMATAGMGDALAGMIGALLAKGLSPLESAREAVCWHSLAGDDACHRHGYGFTAMDVVNCVPNLTWGV